MKYRALGSTGLQVSEISFGTGGNAGLMIAGSFEEQLGAVGRALELGINYFDTAPDYGDGVSETNLGRVLRELSARPSICTKVEIRGENLNDVAGHIERSVDLSLKRLEVDHVDVVMIHNGPVAHKPSLQGRQYNVLSIDDYLREGGAIDGLERVQRAGKTRFLGFVSRGNDGETVRQLIDTGKFQVMNTVYTLLNASAVSAKLPGMDGPDFGQVTPYGVQHGVGSAIYSPLAAGVLTDRIIDGGEPHPSALVRQATDSEVRVRLIARANQFRFLSGSAPNSLAQAAVRFILTNPDVSTVLGGISDVQQLEEVVSASDAGPLPMDVLDRIFQVWRDARVFKTVPAK